MIVRCPMSVSVSMMALRFGSSARTRKMPVPPMPSSGLRMASPMSSMKAFRSCAARAMSVGAVNCANSVMAIFSEWSRTERGWFQTFTPAAAARSSSQVAVMYSKSKGGSWRISTASNAASGSVVVPPGAYQAALSPDTVIACARASTCPSRHMRSGRMMAWMLCPRACAARMMAMLESL